MPLPLPQRSVEVVPVDRATYSEVLPCRQSTADTGRRVVRDVLAIWNLDALVDRAELIITELIANASRHTLCPEIRLVVERPGASCVRVGIVDEEPSRLPRLGHAGDEDESGRGLLLINAVADRWGCDIQGTGRRPQRKEVWAELRTQEEN
ncbi:ATP-binding protein [Streptomyces sp. NPDC001493]